MSYSSLGQKSMSRVVSCLNTNVSFVLNAAHKLIGIFVEVDLRSVPLSFAQSLLSSSSCSMMYSLLPDENKVQYLPCTVYLIFTSFPSIAVCPSL
jgi:hypothetical protein